MSTRHHLLVWLYLLPKVSNETALKQNTVRINIQVYHDLIELEFKLYIFYTGNWRDMAIQSLKELTFYSYLGKIIYNGSSYTNQTTIQQVKSDTGWTVNTLVIFNLKKLHPTESNQQFMKNYRLEKHTYWKVALSNHF